MPKFEIEIQKEVVKNLEELKIQINRLQDIYEKKIQLFEKLKHAILKQSLTASMDF